MLAYSLHVEKMRKVKKDRTFVGKKRNDACSYFTIYSV
jgi:hypothetical protein